MSSKRISHMTIIGILFKRVNKCFTVCAQLGVTIIKLVAKRLNKIILSCFDDKRYILDDGTHSYAYGHCQIGASPRK